MPIGMVVRLAERRAGGILRALGKRGYFARDIVRGVRDPETWIPETIRQMRTMGVESVPLTIIVAAFLGGGTLAASATSVITSVPTPSRSLFGRTRRLQGDAGRSLPGATERRRREHACRAPLRGWPGTARSD